MGWVEGYKLRRNESTVLGGGMVEDASEGVREVLGNWWEEVEVYPPFSRFQGLLKQITNQSSQLPQKKTSRHTLHAGGWPHR